jgi:fructokinase
LPPDDIVAEILRRIAALPATEARHLIAIAGPPGAGKSTLAESVVAGLGPSAVLVPMDGFHLDNALLDARGLRARKGAPETFDADGFVAAMQRLGRGGEVILPVFDRARDIAIAGAVSVATDHRIVVVEGNYLLFDAAPWTDLAPLWDVTVWLEVPEAELQRRLTQRWLDHGLDREAALARAEGNDLANARRIAAARLPADTVLPWL